MKKNLIIALIAAFTSTAMAKIAVYDEQDALSKVLSDSKTMSEIKSKVPGKLVHTGVSSTQLNSGETAFTVRLTYTAATPIGNRSCFVDVGLVTKHGIVPGKRIATNALLIQKINSPICQK